MQENSIDLDVLRSFVAVADRLNFGQAAAALRISAPAMTRRIQRLERAIGVPLLERGTRHVVVTAEGEHFLNLAREATAAVDRAADGARALAAGHAGTLVLTSYNADADGLSLGSLPARPGTPTRPAAPTADRDEELTQADEDEERRLREQRFRQAAKAAALDDMRDFSEVAENTGNPLFLWKALSAWFGANLANEKLGLGNLEMPQQFRTYLAIVSKRLSDLSVGLDYRQTPKPFGELPRVEESVEVASRRMRTLNAPQATKLALHAFGLRRSGWNAFERAMKLAEQDLDTLSQELYRTIGDMGDAEAIEALLEDHAPTEASQRGPRRVLEDARDLRKRIKASRDARRPK